MSVEGKDREIEKNQEDEYFFPQVEERKWESKETKNVNLDWLEPWLSNYWQWLET